MMTMMMVVTVMVRMILNSVSVIDVNLFSINHVVVSRFEAYLRKFLDICDFHRSDDDENVKMAPSITRVSPSLLKNNMRSPSLVVRSKRP